MNKVLKEKIKEAAIYARVSSHRQKEGETIKSQVDSLSSYAAEQGYHLNNSWIFLDEGVSGKNLQRPALDELRDMIRLEAVEYLLVYSTDRLARNYSHQLILLEEFKKHGVKVVFLKNPPSGDTAEAMMLNHFQGIFAEYERALILDRSRRGRIFKAKQGNPVCLSKIAYGYRRIKTNREVLIEVCEEEARVVRDIFKLYVYEKKTLAEIARILTQANIRTPNNSPAWVECSIRTMLKNTSYIGTAYFGKTEGSDGVTERIRRCKHGKFLQPTQARKKVPEENWLPIVMPAIISENDFEEAQKQLQVNRDFASRNTKEPSLLQGLVICGVCGNPFYKRYRKYKENVTGYYSCKTHSDTKLKRCSNIRARQKELDDLVYGETVKMLQNPALVRAELARRAGESSKNQGDEKQEIIYKKELLKIDQERDRLLDVYQGGLIDLGGLKKRYQESDQRRNILEKELKSIQARKFDKENIINLEKGFEDIVKRMKVSAENLTLKEKRKLIRLVVQEVVVSPEEIKVVHCISPQLLLQEFGQLSLDGLAIFGYP